MKFWKLQNCTFCDITSSNVHRFSSNLQNRHSFIQTILMRGKIPMLTPKLHMSEIWSELKKQKISFNFWVNVGMWPIVSVWLAMPDETVMSEYMIYMVWKLVVTFCPITSVTFIWQFQKLVVTGLTQQCWHACTNESLEISKLYILWNNFIKCAQIFLQTFRTDIVLSRQFYRGVKTLCSHQNYTCLKFGLNQKSRIYCLIFE